MTPSEYALADGEAALRRLLELLRIPSVSAVAECSEDVRRAATWVAERARAAGFPVVAVEPTARHPVVFADWTVGEHLPTILVYGHYDVQPADPVENWDSPPFEPVVRNGRWQLLECVPAWEGNWTCDCFLAFAWQGPAGERLLVAVNYAPNQSQCHVRLPFSDLAGNQWQLKDQIGSAAYTRDGNELRLHGLFLDMSPWEAVVFSFTKTGRGVQT